MHLLLLALAPHPANGLPLEAQRGVFGLRQHGMHQDKMMAAHEVHARRAPLQRQEQDPILQPSQHEEELS